MPEARLDEVLIDRVPRAVLELVVRPRGTDKQVPLADGFVVAVAVAGAKGRAAARALDVPAVIVEADQPLPPDTGALVDVRALDAPADLVTALTHAKGSLFLAQTARPLLLAAARAGGAFYVMVTALDGPGHDVTGAVHGLLKTAALEWPEVACAVVDIHPALDAGAALKDELHTGFYDVEVALSPEGRRVPVVVERPAVISARRPSPSSVWVASGGARGVTATTLLALAKEARPSLLLLGRTPLAAEPASCASARDEASLKRALIEDAKVSGRSFSLMAIGEEAKRVLAVREIASFVRDLESAGARVMYRAVDVRDVDAVSAACAQARSAFGPITGIVHGAGVLADKRIEDKTAEQVDRVMDTKVKGLDALLRATASDPVDTIALFSSVAGRFGNVGQVDYAMANEALNEVAHKLAQQRPGVVVKSMNWGPWEGGMVTPALKKVFEERGVRVLSHADGARHFVDELSTDDGAVETVYGGELSPEADTKKVAPAPASRAEWTEAGPVASKRFHVDEKSWPFLADHALKGMVVFPVVGAIELFARTTGARVFEDVKVLRGIKLPRFAVEGHDLDVVRQAHQLKLFVGGNEPACYSARVGNPATPFTQLTAPALEPGTFGDVYAGLLFHGERFHLVDKVEGVGRAGLVARVRGSEGRDWGDGLATDMGALDAALQAALLWTRQVTGGAFLPTAIDRVRVAEPVSGPLSCVLVARSLDDTRGVCDVQLLDMSGRVAFALEGVAVHRLPDDAAFAPAPAPALEAAR